MREELAKSEARALNFYEMLVPKPAKHLSPDDWSKRHS